MVVDIVVDKLSNMVVDLEVDKMAYMVVDNALWAKLLRKWEIGKFNKITS